MEILYPGPLLEEVAGFDWDEGNLEKCREPSMKRKSRARKTLPRLKSDREAEHFVAEADLTRFDLREMKATRFEFVPKEARVNMRLPGELLAAVKRAADRAGVPYQRFIRQALEQALSDRK